MFLKLQNKTFLITGVANKKSVATHVANILIQEGAKVLISIQKEEMRSSIEKLFPVGTALYVLDVQNQKDLLKLKEDFEKEQIKLDGFLHSLAFARMTEGKIPPFHETSEDNFMEAASISSFSFVKLSNHLKSFFKVGASCVAVSISSTKATSYGFLGPIKALLEACVPFLAKSFAESGIRFNAVCAGPLKTSASAGIPGYLENYLYAEQLILRKKALETSEVANTICFLLSPASSGINAERIVVDGGMNANYFDERIVHLATKI
jgi:enoyl-[acyl-carrier protein] reductase I